MSESRVQRLRHYLGSAALAGGLMIGAALILSERPKTQAPPDRKLVKLWHVVGAEDEPPTTPRWFNESQDKIYVQDIGLPFLEIEQKFLTAAVGNIPPDLFEYFGSVAQWSTRGALLPLDEFIERDGFDRSSIFPALWEEMQWAGRTYAIPTGTGNEAFYWNKQHFREVGLDPERPPQTWDELEEYANKLATRSADGAIDRAGYIPGYWGPSPTSLFLNWPLQKGAKFLSADGRTANVASRECIEALDWEGKLFRRLGGEELILKRSSFGYGTQHGFIGGKLSMIVQKSSFPQEVQKFAPKLEYGVALLPVPADGKKAVVAGAAWIGIPVGARDPEAAWQYIKYYVKPDTQLAGAKYMAERNLVAFFPANVEAAKSDFVQSLPHMDVFVKSMEWAHTSTVVPLAHTVFWRTYQDAWDQVIRGDRDAATALKQAQATVQKALDEQWEYSRFYTDYTRKRAAKEIAIK